MPGPWELDNFEEFLANRRVEQAAALNELLGLPEYQGCEHGLEGEVPDDEDAMDSSELIEVAVDR